MTQSGKLVMIETKGDHMWNDESKAKLHLGRKWAAEAGSKYRYFMVFKEKITHEDGGVYSGRICGYDEKPVISFALRHQN